MSIANLFTFMTITPLQEKAMLLGICPKCHKKTLKSKHMAAEIDWHQCSVCLSVFAMPERRLIG